MTTNPAAAANQDVGLKRSGTAYPYFDLGSSVKAADMVYTKGGGTCTADQLAAWLGYASTRSGTFFSRVASAKYFGLLTSTGDTFAVTERAKTILAPVMPSDSVNAKVEAFLSVPFFLKLYDHFKGAQLPPEVGLKNLFQNTHKILPGQVQQAVRVFLDSAEQAGFFTTTGDRSRLVKPSGATAAAATPAPPSEQPPAPEKPKGGGGGGGEGPPGVHSAIVGLLRELPPAGTEWADHKKKRFLDAFKATIDFIYPAPEEGSP